MKVGPSESAFGSRFQTTGTTQADPGSIGADPQRNKNSYCQCLPGAVWLSGFQSSDEVRPN